MLLFNLALFICVWCASEQLPVIITTGSFLWPVFIWAALPLPTVWKSEAFLFKALKFTASSKNSLMTPTYKSLFWVMPSSERQPCALLCLLNVFEYACTFVCRCMCLQVHVPMCAHTHVETTDNRNVVSQTILPTPATVFPRQNHSVDWNPSSSVGYVASG